MAAADRHRRAVLLGRPRECAALQPFVQDPEAALIPTRESLGDRHGRCGRETDAPRGDRGRSARARGPRVHRSSGGDRWCRSPRRCGPPARSSARRAQRRDDVPHEIPRRANHHALAVCEHDLNDAGVWRHVGGDHPHPRKSTRRVRARLTYLAAPIIETRRSVSAGRRHAPPLRRAGGSDRARGGLAGPHPHAGGRAAAVGAGQAGAVSEGPVLTIAAAGISALAEAVWGQHLWARGYFCATDGAVDEKTVMQYIESQKWDQNDEGFKITAPTEPWAGSLPEPLQAASAASRLSVEIGVYRL
jgi:hypothetical protein